MFGARDARGATSFTPTPGAWATQMQRDLAAARAMDTTGPTNADVAKMTELMASRAADRWNAITARADTAPTPDAQRAGLSAATEAFRGEFEPTWAPALFAAAAKAGVRPGGKLAIYPDGSSAMLPIGLLRNPKTGKALMEEYELVFAPSPSVLARAEARAAQSAAKKAALVAPAQPDLRFTPIEAAIIARGFGAAAPAASTDKSAILAGLSGASYWHFATHGGFFPEAPLDSGVLVRPVKPGAAPDFDRDVLTLRDLLSGDSVTTPRLVLLSACRTGLFNAKLTPDEFLGLPSGFLALGAAGVVSSLWSVDDVATALLIGKFYQLHLGGKRPSEALREAQIWLAGADKAAIEAFVASQEGAGGLSAAQAATLRQAVAAAPDAQQPFANPYYWGAFTFYGA
jgi:CHAT domain-containing protein